MPSQLLHGGGGNGGVAIIALSRHRESERTPAGSAIQRLVAVPRLRRDELRRLPSGTVDRGQVGLSRAKLLCGVRHPNRGLRLSQGKRVSSFRLGGGKPLLKGAGLQPLQFELAKSFTQPIYLTLGGENLPFMMELAGGQAGLGAADLGREILDPRLLVPAARGGGRQFLAGRLENRPGGLKLHVAGGAFFPLLHRRENGDTLTILEGERP